MDIRWPRAASRGAHSPLLLDLLHHEQRVLLLLARLELGRSRGRLVVPYATDDADRQLVAVELVDALGNVSVRATLREIDRLGLLRWIQPVGHLFPIALSLPERDCVSLEVERIILDLVGRRGLFAVVDPLRDLPGSLELLHFFLRGLVLLVVAG